MAIDKLIDSTQLNSDLTTVANAIRTKGGANAQLSFPNGMAQAIADIPAAGSARYVDITLMQEITSGGQIIRAIQTASGFDNCYAELISPVPESGACVTAVVVASQPVGTFEVLYRRTSTGAWGMTSPGAQHVYVGDIFRVWEVGQCVK